MRVFFASIGTVVLLYAGMKWFRLGLAASRGHDTQPRANRPRMVMALGLVMMLAGVTIFLAFAILPAL